MKKVLFALLILLTTSLAMMIGYGIAEVTNQLGLSTSEFWASLEMYLQNRYTVMIRMAVGLWQDDPWLAVMFVILILHWGYIFVLQVRLWHLTRRLTKIWNKLPEENPEQIFSNKLDELSQQIGRLFSVVWTFMQRSFFWGVQKVKEWYRQLNELWQRIDSLFRVAQDLVQRSFFWGVKKVKKWYIQLSIYLDVLRRTIL